MINKAINFIRKELNTYVKNYMLQDPEVITHFSDYIQLTNMLEPDSETSGTPVKPNKIGLTLINIEEERITKAQVPVRLGPDGKLGKSNPELKLNLYLLFSANADTNISADGYIASLKLIDAVIAFFQHKNVFTLENSPALDSSIGRMMFDMHSFPVEQQSYVWGALGAQYLPSVVYKARIIVVQQAQSSHRFLYWCNTLLTSSNVVFCSSKLKSSSYSITTSSKPFRAFRGFSKAAFTSGECTNLLTLTPSSSTLKSTCSCL